MKTPLRLSLMSAVLLTLASCKPAKQSTPPPQADAEVAEVKNPAAAKFTGSESCRPCHERFYKLWAPSHHGKAMQPFTKELADTYLKPQAKPVVVNGTSYRYLLEDGKGWVIQSGKAGEKRYPMIHAMGGKNMFFFLTPLEKGKLQVLPIAYNVKTNVWYDTMGSMVRHFSDVDDAPLDWHDPLMTFNTACYSCHVSQLSNNYDAKTGTYNTVWREPGINCETCHGPASEHVDLYAGKPADFVPPDGDPKVIVMRKLTAVQRDETCAPCHAKMHAITEGFGPGDRYFDHHDLATFEDRDFYPDGRDLGENYTYTLWLTNPCAKAGKLECLHCHTSSGRNRHADDPNKACADCHPQRVANATKHTHHPADSDGNHCVSCHMPMTSFSRMQRSDHSFRPPTPAATIEFKSPNACNNCHSDKTPQWADAHVRKWHGDYQEKPLERARLIAAARKNDWSKLDGMLAYLSDPASDGIFVNSLVRLLAACPDPKKGPVLRKLTRHPMPIVRSSAVSGLRDVASEESLSALIAACSDEFRLVRIRAAYGLAIYSERMIPADKKEAVKTAIKELETSFGVRADQWGYLYNRGNYLMDKGEFKGALEAFETAHALRKDVIMPLVNGSMAAAQLKKPEKSVEFLEKARQIEPKNAGVLFNLGLAYGELKRFEDAKDALYAALAVDPANGPVAYNLGLMVMADDPQEGLRLCRIAVASKPPRPAYAYALAFHLSEQGQTGEAIGTLKTLVESTPNHLSGIFLLAELYEGAGRKADAKALCESILRRDDLEPRVRMELMGLLRRLNSGK